MAAPRATTVTGSIPNSSLLPSSDCTATRAPVMVCPAMHTEMWEHPAVQANVATLRSRGVHVVEPEEGRLAGGDVGAGRLAAPERIVAAVEALFAEGTGDRAGYLAGLHVVVSAGGTREPIDAVRVIANRSSGKQGYAIAAEAASRGAQVTLVSTVELPVPSGVAVRPVETAAQMQAALEALAPAADIVVMAAADLVSITAGRGVADRPARGRRPLGPAGRGLP